MDATLSVSRGIRSPSEVAEDFLRSNYVHCILVVIITQVAAILSVLTENVFFGVLGAELPQTPYAYESFLNNFSLANKSFM